MHKITKLKRRGFIEKTVIFLIIMMTIFLLLLVFTGKVKDIYQKNSESSICQTSVMQQNSLSFKGTTAISDIHIKCPTLKINIDNTHKKDENKVKRQVADELYQVCNEFNRGDLDLFGNKEAVFCVIRKIISFKDKNQKIDGMTKFIFEESPENLDKPYYYYCAPHRTEEIGEIYSGMGLADKEQFNQRVLDTSKEYAIIFVYAKGEKQLEHTFNTVFGTSPTHITMYLGIAVVVLSAKITVPMILGGKFLAWSIGAAGLSTSGISGVINWFIEKKPQHASFFVIREYNLEELQTLGCEYLPAEQN